MKDLSIFLSLTVSFIATAADNVGVVSRTWADSSRSNWTGTGPRPLRAIVWYPAEKGGTKEVITDPVQFTTPVDAFHDAPVTTGQRPLILISHGARGHAFQMRWLGYYLASKGYIAVIIDHNGTDAEERAVDGLTLTDFNMWERPRDLSAVLDLVLKDSQFGAVIDTSRIGAAGFSLGGTTVIWKGGAILDVDTLGRKEGGNIPDAIKAAINTQKERAENDPILINSRKHSGDSYKDGRIKAIFALAPAIGQGFPADGLRHITVPVQIVVGDADVVTPIETNAKYYATNIPSAKPLIVFHGERGHYTQPPKGNERPKEYEEISRIAYTFFKKNL
jgi:predicted dienelactone hydrolase